MNIIRATQDRVRSMSTIWREHREKEDGGVTDDVAMIGLMVAGAVGVGAFLVPWLAAKIGEIDVGW